LYQFFGQKTINSSVGDCGTFIELSIISTLGNHRLTLADFIKAALPDCCLIGIPYIRLAF
jgi:hypothetical protein